MSKARNRVEPNSSEVRALLRDQEMQDYCLECAQKIADTAERIGKGSYMANVVAGQNRAHAIATTKGIRSYFDNKRNNTLLKAMGGK